jgi:hypothetical protein
VRGHGVCYWLWRLVKAMIWGYGLESTFFVEEGRLCEKCCEVLMDGLIKKWISARVVGLADTDCWRLSSCLTT